MSLAEYESQALREREEFIPHLGPTKQAEATSLHIDDRLRATLDALLEPPMQLTGFSVRPAIALSGLHKRELIRKDLKPSKRTD